MTTEFKPKISVVMVDGSFRERFHLLDFLADQTLPTDDYEVIWVEYYGAVKPALAAKVEACPNSRVITLDKEGTYHSSYCFNAGIQAARGELILIPDADIAVERSFLETVLQEHLADEKLVMYLHRVDEPEPSTQDAVELDHLRRTCRFRHPSNYGACLTVRKKWLLEINGYEQHPVFGTGLHANGLDVYTRFKNLGMHVMWHPKLPIYHPWHPMTKAWDVSYRLQKLVISHRAVTRDALAYEGIDAERNRPMPPELVARIEKAGRFSRVLVHRIYSGVRAWFR